MPLGQVQLELSVPIQILPRLVAILKDLEKETGKKIAVRSGDIGVKPLLNGYEAGVQQGRMMQQRVVEGKTVPEVDPPSRRRTN